MGPRYRLPHAAARPVICPWAPVPPPHAAARSRVSHGFPVRPPIAAVFHRHTLPCATFRSPHTAGGFHFVIGCCMAFPLLLPPPPHCGSTLWFWPRDCPNE
ncbi:unnamed protein product [Staurois parvus]|uniref:Uncharacterized protein n=1 Tax=Staurois parvus TaxID=386267 RepID=A0ABN9DV39_9NEOB|nr:unnamed protein product [Staurois parvus]